MKTFENISIRPVISAMLFITSVIVASCDGRGGESTSREDKIPGSEITTEAPAIDIHTAILMGDMKVLNLHIKAGTDLNTKEPANGSTPLISAIVFGKREAAMALIEAGADLNSVNNDGSTALYCAAFFCRPGIVRVLLEKGADKSIRNRFGSTALESVSSPFDDVKEIYSQISRDFGPLGFKLDFEFVETTRPEIAEMLR